MTVGVVEQNDRTRTNSRLEILRIAHVGHLNVVDVDMRWWPRCGFAGHENQLLELLRLNYKNKWRSGQAEALWLLLAWTMC